MYFRLACPCCAESGDWTIRGQGETWTAPGGREVPVVAGQCDRCGSTVMFEPSEQAVQQIAFRERARRERLKGMRAMADHG